MGMKPENKFRVWFIERLRADILARHPHATFSSRKHADYANAGIPDMDISINGITLWLEFKLVPKVTKERKIDVTDLQRDELSTLTKARVPAGVLVGLPLGPRQGYEVAYYDQTIPTSVRRTDFGPLQAVFNILYSQAYVSAEQAFNLFKLIALSKS